MKKTKSKTGHHHLDHQNLDHQNLDHQDLDQQNRLENQNRRDFLKTATAAVSGMALAAHFPLPAEARGSRSKGKGAQSQSVMDMVAPKMDVVRFGVIGVGDRGSFLLQLIANVDGSDVKAVCDTDERSLAYAKALMKGNKKHSPKYYAGNDFSYRKMLERDDIDGVIIATPWRWHAQMSVEVMEAGKHVFVEVPAGVNVDELWQLVETSERTQLYCMMLENVCYGPEEMMVLNMVRQKVFGELTHGEAAYIHDLRAQMKQTKRRTGSWRTGWHTKFNGNLYPTHGLGPIAQYMDINRGDQFDYMASMSSPALGRALFAEKEFAEGHARRDLKHIAGDMNSSIIKTKKGRTILVQYDTTTPRPYTRLNLIQGTNGVFAGFPSRIALETLPDGMVDDRQHGYHAWDYDMEKWFERYHHPIWQTIEKEAKEQGGHGGMDFVMLWRLVYCLRNGIALDQNVYDAASWSVIRPLSEVSIQQKGSSVDIPDFTNGVWETAKSLDIKL